MATLNYNWQLIKEVDFYVFATSKLRLYGKLNSQDTAKNKSNVSFQVRQQPLAGNFYDTGNYVDLWCNGSNRGRQYFNSSVSSAGEQTIGTWTFDLNHNSDGTFNSAVSTSANVYGSMMVNITDTSFSLPTIPREATIKSSADITLNGLTTKQTLTFENPAKFPLKLEYIWGNTAQITRTIGAVTQQDITFTQDEYIKLSKQTSYTLRVTTYTNTAYNVKVGSSDKAGTITCKGRLNIYKSGYKKAIPFVYKNGKWNLATLNIYKSGWKVGG